MASLADFASNTGSILDSLSLLFPGILAYFVYIGLRTDDFERIKTSHVILILVFTLFFQILGDISGVLMDSRLYLGAFYFAFPFVLGVTADLAHRFFVSVFVEWYQRDFIAGFEALSRIDVGNVSRWQNTVRDYALSTEGDYTEYYAEVTVETGDSAGLVRGFVTGYSDDDIELYRYDDVTDKDFTDIGELDIDDEMLTQRTEVIDRDHIASIALYRLRMNDFRLG